MKYQYPDNKSLAKKLKEDFSLAIDAALKIKNKNESAQEVSRVAIEFSQTYIHQAFNEIRAFTGDQELIKTSADGIKAAIKLLEISIFGYRKYLSKLEWACKILDEKLPKEEACK